MSVSVTAIKKRFPPASRGGRAVQALDGIDLGAADGELLVVVGPSGSGKTTLLRCVAGLERPDEGSIAVGGREVADLPAGERDVAMVFQEYALYPHVSARDNISFGLRARKVPARTIENKVNLAAEMLGLDDALDRRPGELSGGERQRVALARAIVREPAAFLMDEPLANLDAELRARTRTEIRRLVKRLGTTTVYVTHDQIEAMTMGDRVAVLRAGRLEQVAAPLTLYERPATAFVAGFLGTPPMNLLPADLVGAFESAEQIGIRPERIRFAGVAEGRLSGKVTAVENVGAESIAHVEVQGHPILIRAGHDGVPATGEEVGLVFLDADVHPFDAAGKAIG